MFSSIHWFPLELHFLFLIQTLAHNWVGGDEQNYQPCTCSCPLKSEGITDIRFPFLALFPTIGQQQIRAIETLLLIAFRFQSWDFWQKFNHSKTHGTLLANWWHTRLSLLSLTDTFNLLLHSFLLCMDAAPDSC